MRAHEIVITEAGILQGIKKAAAGVRGAVSGYRQSQQQRQVQDVAVKALKIWNNYAQQLKAANPDPVRYGQLYQQALASFVQKNLLRGTSIAQAVNQQEMQRIIADITKQANDPQAVAKLFPELIQQSALAMPSAERAMSTGVNIISQNPVVVQFRNKTYIISSDPASQGEWIDQATGRVLDPTWQAFLDQQTGLGQP